MCYAKNTGKGRCSPTHAQKVAHAARQRSTRANKTLAQTLQERKDWVGDYTLDTTHADVAKAYNIAIIGHSGVKRENGEPYINHPLRVARKLQDAGMDSSIVAVALLHDVVEDSDYTLDDLRRKGFSEEIVDAVDSVTKRDGEPYEEAIKRALSNEIGRIVKLSDNLDNSSHEQTHTIAPEKRERVTLKYKVAREKLIPYIHGAITTRVSKKITSEQLDAILNSRYLQPDNSVL